MKHLAPFVLTLALALGSGAALAAPIKAEVFKSPYCGCCGKWVEHLKQNGFDVTVRETDDLPAQRKALGMPDKYASCHSTRIAGYVVEGHVPAADVRKLLAEKPKALGIAAPGMPQSAPGMDTGGKAVPYDTLLVMRDGSARTFARH
ncbi:DUF411 domain-containing protein [Niveibacterium sp. SC-1]|uniref:DUF411 domain-containing protein n=1 Tax=Niveibacterium sp. SC-1 TaxID=3135646 RepID=UPI00312045BF